jgi:hypothetical protein
VVLSLTETAFQAHQRKTLSGLASQAPTPGKLHSSDTTGKIKKGLGGLVMKLLLLLEIRLFYIKNDL